MSQQEVSYCGGSSSACVCLCLCLCVLCLESVNVRVKDKCKNCVYEKERSGLVRSVRCVSVCTDVLPYFLFLLQSTVDNSFRLIENTEIHFFDL